MLRKINSKNLLWLILSTALIISDQVTKLVISANMQMGDKIEVIKGFFYIGYTKNTGAAWGMFSGHTEYLAIFSVVAT